MSKVIACHNELRDWQYRDDPGRFTSSRRTMFGHQISWLSTDDPVTLILRFCSAVSNSDVILIDERPRSCSQ